MSDHTVGANDEYLEQLLNELERDEVIFEVGGTEEADDHMDNEAEMQATDMLLQGRESPAMYPQINWKRRLPGLTETDYQILRETSRLLTLIGLSEMAQYLPLTDEEIITLQVHREMRSGLEGHLNDAIDDILSGNEVIARAQIAEAHRVIDLTKEDISNKEACNM